MEACYIEPRKAIWAVAEISWADAGGTALQARATLQDISASGACLRVKAPIEIGARVKVKWHREQFSAITRNCRRDGMDYLLGVRREADPSDHGSPNVAGEDSASGVSPRISPQPPVSISCGGRSAGSGISSNLVRVDVTGNIAATESKHAPRGEERNVMEPKKLFSPFWRRPHEASAPEPVTHTEAPMKQAKDSAGEAASGPRNELLSYDDIYHAAGLMSPRSGYGIHKVIEMLNSERIRDLSKDIKRASVLMALDAAGASTEELVQDAQRRQHALNSYEDGQRKQLEEFETRKTQENARLQAEMERLAAHYAERIQRNRDEVAREKDVLHNWQMAKQHEMQRISEVMEVCSRQPDALAMAAGAAQVSDAGRNVRPTLIGEVTNRG